PDQRRFIYGVIAFVNAVRHQLRGSDGAEELRALLPPEWHARCVDARYPPTMILLLLSEELQRWRIAGQIEPILAAQIDNSLVRLTDSLGGCERIASTPMPFAYSVLLHRTIYVYSFLLPFGLVESIGPLTPLIVAFISYTFFALEALAEEIEGPFDLAANDLP